MKKKFTKLLSLTLGLILAVSPVSANAASGDITVLDPLKITDAVAKDNIKPYEDHWYKGTLSVDEDLSDERELLYSLTVSSKTKFKKTPAEFDLNETIEWGKDPGLGVDILKKHGFTGKGVSIAYVDQPIAGHKEYSSVKLHYKNNSNADDSMHGPAVLSLLAGKDIGISPDAEIYYYAHSAWFADQTTHAECLYQIIKQNKKLPDDKKIRMVGFSDNIDPREKNEEAFREAVKACEDAGVMVWFCGDYCTAAFSAGSDRNNPNNLYNCSAGNVAPPLVYIPAGSRTTASVIFDVDYIYWGDGGTSWTMPYALGLYTDALAIDPSLTKEDLKSLIVSTATINKDGLKIINPIEFISTVLERVGRSGEAASLRAEYKASLHYFYAIINESKTSAEDMKSIEAYLKTIKGTTVLKVDASGINSATDLYSLLKSDAKERGGIIDGIQIFGDGDAVPAFDVTYRVQMKDEIDEGGQIKSDLFYGNFDNNVSDIGSSYSVYDQFKDNKNITLTPSWPVVRLPLKEGQYSTFFEKYGKFADETRYKNPTVVNFSNPIFASKDHIDDMGAFLDRMKSEFKVLKKNDYKLYGNQLGDYPVNNKNLLGGFTAENLTKENKAGITEYIINSHGQTNNIDKCYFENGKEIRESLVNSDTINSVLSDNPYYLDCWTCNNGYALKDNLTTTALSGKCVGMFSATTIISNNGVDCNASVSKMKESNFYYFYYTYIKALYAGKTRAAAFNEAQKAYGKALISHSKKGISYGNNYQFNLYNLFVYENFGVIEPNTFIGDSLKVISDDSDADVSLEGEFDKIIKKGKSVTFKTKEQVCRTRARNRSNLKIKTTKDKRGVIITGKKKGIYEIEAYNSKDKLIKKWRIKVV